MLFFLPNIHVEEEEVHRYKAASLLLPFCPHLSDLNMQISEAGLEDLSTNMMCYTHFKSPFVREEFPASATQIAEWVQIQGPKGSRRPWT